MLDELVFSKFFLIFGFIIQVQCTFGLINEAIELTRTTTYKYGNGSESDIYPSPMSTQDNFEPKLLILVPKDSWRVQFNKQLNRILAFLHARFVKYDILNIKYKLNGTQFRNQSEDILDTATFLRSLEKYKFAEFTFLGDFGNDKGDTFLSSLGLRPMFIPPKTVCTFKSPINLDEFSETQEMSYSFLVFRENFNCPRLELSRKDVLQFGEASSVQLDNRYFMHFSANHGDRNFSKTSIIVSIFVPCFVYWVIISL